MKAKNQNKFKKTFFLGTSVALRVFFSSEGSCEEQMTKFLWKCMPNFSQIFAATINTSIFVANFAADFAQVVTNRFLIWHLSQFFIGFPTPPPFLLYGLDSIS